MLELNDKFRGTEDLKIAYIKPCWEFHSETQWRFQAEKFLLISSVELARTIFQNDLWQYVI